MKDNLQGRQQGENNNFKIKILKSSQKLRSFPRDDAELLKGFTPKMPLA